MIMKNKTQKTVKASPSKGTLINSPPAYSSSSLRKGRITGDSKTPRRYDTSGMSPLKGLLIAE